MAPGYLSTQQIAEKLGVSRMTIHNWVKRGYVKPTETIGAVLLWTGEDLPRLKALKGRAKVGRPRKQSKGTQKKK